MGSAGRFFHKPFFGVQNRFFKSVSFLGVYFREAHGVASRGSRVLRGGSWNNNTTNVRVANRNNNTPTNTNNNNGFRCAKTLVEKAFSDCQSWYASEVGESSQACMNEESKACYLR